MSAIMETHRHLGGAIVALLAGRAAVIEATGGADLYYTLASVALLAVVSAGVWLTFYIGRINIRSGRLGADRRLCRRPGHESRLVVLVDPPRRGPTSAPRPCWSACGHACAASTSRWCR
ncbi:MAG: hypothetical protein R3E83_13455 [Burkholderiaceae bacterium]